MTTLEYPPFLDAATKGFAAALVVAAAIVLATHAAIRHGKLKAFGGWARIVR